jgi:hypothetical protein
MIGAEDSKNKSGGVGEYLVDGEWKTYSDEVVRRALAEAEATANLEGMSDELIKATAALGGFAEALTEGEGYTDLEGQVIEDFIASGGDITTLEPLSDESRSKILADFRAGNIDLNDYIKNWDYLPYDNAEAASTAIIQGITNYNT